MIRSTYNMSLYYISLGGYESKNVNIRSVKGFWPTGQRPFTRTNVYQDVWGICNLVTPYGVRHPGEQ